MTTKPSNPKDVVGIAKAPMSAVPTVVLHEMGLGMLDGALKYGRHNYRAVGVRSSVYYDAAMRHLNAWWEGEDIDPDSGLSHITKIMTTLAVLRDSQIRGNVVDDRPPSSEPGWMNRMNEHAAMLIERYKGKNPKHYTIGDVEPAPTQTPLPDIVEMVDKLGQVMPASTQEEYDAFYKLGYRPTGRPYLTAPRPVEPTLEETCKAVIAEVKARRVEDPEFNIVYHTEQRPTGPHLRNPHPGPGSTSPIKDEIKARLGWS